ncbi:hypothetical protein ID866_11575 [Astraeus odoratus]|nr:hypothetical protein ID866_11575 [Astraeus odoratus]
MSSPRHTSSPHEHCLAKTKAPKERTEEEWRLVSEGELDPMSSNDENMVKMQDREKKWRVEVQKDEHQRRQEAMEHQACEEAEQRAQEEAEQRAQEEAERKAEEERKAQEAVARAKEEAERRAKEDVEREDTAWRAVEAVEERVNAERRALKERLWEAVGQQSAMAVAPLQVAKPSRRMTVVGPSAPGWQASGVQDPCTRCCNKGTPCVFGAAKGKTMACEACRHVKVSCSWTKRTAGEKCKWKWVQQSEDVEEKEVVDVDADEEEDKEQSHFAVLTHLTEEHRDALGALMTTLDMLSMEFYEFRRDYWGFGAEVLKVMDTIAQELKRANDLKEEEMGRAKGKGKEKAQEEFRRVRMEDDDRDMEMGRAGPSLV